MALWSELAGNMTGNGSEVVINATSRNLSYILSFKQPLDIPHIRWIYITLFGMVFLCCVLGNATVIYVILRHKKMRNITNFFLANLAFSDICVGVFCVLPNLMTFLFPYWMLGRVLCKLYYFIQCTSYTASILILTVISLERYFAIIHPMFNKRVTRMYLLRVVVIIIWLCAALYGTPNLIAYDLYRVRTDDDDNNNKTLDFCVTTGQWNIDMEVYSILNFIVLYLLPLLLIVVMYMRISNALWRSESNMALNAFSPQRNPELTPKRTYIRCPRCKQVVYNDDQLAKGKLFGSKGKFRSNKEHDILIDDGRVVRSSLLSASHVTNVSQWTRTVEEASDDDVLPPKHCQCNSRVTRVVTKATGTSTKRKTSRKASNPLTKRRRVIRLLIVVILSFAVCVLPHHIRLLWQYWLTPTATYSFVHMLIPPSTFLFFYANSALNPFLYAFLSEQFRRAFVDLLPNQWRCAKESRSPGQRSRNKSHTGGNMSDIQLQNATSHTVCRLTTSGVHTSIVTEYV